MCRPVTTAVPGTTPAAGAPLRLGPRERDVLRPRDDGRSTAQIAAALSISTDTVRSLLTELGVDGWPAAVRRAREQRIL